MFVGTVYELILSRRLHFRRDTGWTGGQLGRRSVARRKVLRGHCREREGSLRGISMKSEDTLGVPIKVEDQSPFPSAL